MIRAVMLGRGGGVFGARVLAAGLAAHHPDVRLTVLLGAADRRRLGKHEAFDIVGLSDLGQPGLDELVTAVPLEVSAAVLRPLLVRHALDAGAYGVLLLPDDAEVHGPLDALVDGLAGAPAVLVPRLTGTLPDDGARPDGGDLLREGTIDHELIAVRGDATGRALVDWWVDRAFEAAAAARPRGSQAAHSPRAGATPLDVASTVFPSVRRLEDPAYDVSYWNLHERSVTDGVRLIRFTGFRPDRPWWLSSYGSRVLVVDDPVLGPLCGQRARALREAGWTPDAERAGAHDELAGGVLLDERLRRLHAQALEEDERFGDLDSASGVERFLDWLGAPGPAGRETGINRYAFDVWRERADVREAYPDLDGADAEGFVGWLWVHGRDELGLQTSLLPPPPDWVDAGRRSAPGVLVAGYLRGTLGLGQAARGYTAALRAADVPVVTRTVATDPLGNTVRRQDDTPFEELSLDGVEPEVELLCVNADQLPELVAELGPARGRHRIGQWAWETDAIPDRWASAYTLVDELWVYSRYVAENLGRASPVPVVVVPLPVEAPPAPAGPTGLDLGADDYVFLFVFDYLSTAERKNPAGLIEAFTRAFAPGEGPRLVIKTIRAADRPQERERLRHLARGRDDIVFLDAMVPAPQLQALFARADAYVSLHRSEGFGLTLAEAMALGKPVIATAFGGVTDFMTPDNSYGVAWSRVPVGPDAEHYPADGTWAEPSVEHAAALMRAVWTDRPAAARRGAQAREDVRTLLGAEAVGAIARARLERIAARRGGAPAAAPSWPLDQAQQRLGFALGGGSRGPRGLLKRSALRAMRPYTAPERALDEAVVRSLRRLQLDLEAERAARDRDRDRIARLEARLAALLDSRPG